MKLEDLLFVIKLYEYLVIIEGEENLLYKGKNCYFYEYCLNKGIKNPRNRKVNKIECYGNKIYLYIERG